MKNFLYGRASSTRAAVDFLSNRKNAFFLAGGTNLLDHLKLGVEYAEVLLDIEDLPERELTDLEEGGLRLGALALNSEVAADARVKSNFPMLAEAILSGASPQLRNMATIGGNLLQRTRCSFFRDIHAPCNKRNPGSGCAALEGAHRNHAILGTSEDCFATHPSDMDVALAALDAVLVIRGVTGERRLPLESFYLLPGDTPWRETALAHGEMITAVELPPPFFVHSIYLKVRERASFEFALAAAAVALEVREGMILAARVALGGVGTVPWRAREAERLLVGAFATPEAFEVAAEAELAAALPHRDNFFKVELARRTLVRALSEVAEKWGGFE
ncbi:MAG TPA: molybdopterin dehydrogenase [Cyanobacteria bacterium UBA8530]|nr:molybdopterin dehydrogenase [Cyanobacteria bacterium UBA8530]